MDKWTISTVENKNKWIPQGFMLVSMFFNLSVSDLELGVNNKVARFADDTNIINIVNRQPNDKCSSLSIGIK